MPGGGAACDGLLLHRAGDRIVQVVGGSATAPGRHLLHAGMLAVIGERKRVGAIGHHRRHVEGVGGDGALAARDHVAVLVVGEVGIGDAVVGAGDARQRVRARASGAIGKTRPGADVRLAGDVAKSPGLF